VARYIVECVSNWFICYGINTSFKGDMMVRLWRVWVKALGEKSGANDREADYIAIVRSVIVGLNFITCLFIIAGVIHNW
jgi:hypothetical protein